MALNPREIQIAQELSLLNFGKVYPKLNAREKGKIITEFMKVRNLPTDKLERYLSAKLIKEIDEI